MGWGPSFSSQPRRCFLGVFPDRFEQQGSISLFHQETQLPERGVVSCAAAFQSGNQFLVLRVVLQEVPDGEDCPLADERIVAVNVAVIQDERDAFKFSHLVLVVGIAVAEVSYEPDEVCLKADDRRIRRRVSISTEGGEVLSSTENILTGLPSGVYLLQELNSSY